MLIHISESNFLPSRRQPWSPQQMESKLGLLDELKIQTSYILMSCKFID